VTSPTTIGTLLINESLPEDLRLQDSTPIDKKKLTDLLRRAAERYPDRYKEIVKTLNDVGRSAAYTEGVTVSLSALQKTGREKALIRRARARLLGIAASDKSREEKNKAIIDTVLPMVSKLEGVMKEEAEKENNPYWFQVKSGARGKMGDFNAIRGASGLVNDHRNQLVPIPILHSLGEGLDPVEYWAGTYGQRRGMIDVKFAVGDAGFLNKQLVNAAHRIVVNRDKPPETRLPVGLPVRADDEDNVGAVLAKDAGPYKAGQTITSEVLAGLRDADVEDILIHSPMTEPSSDGGVSRWAAGRRDRPEFSHIGDNIGIPAAQSLGERLAQGMLDSKHQAGATGTDKVSRSGFEYINRLIQSPEVFPEAGPLSEVEGRVQEVRKAPQGGHYIVVEGTEYYAGPGVNPTVSPGETVEPGDDLTDGTPHPNQLLRLRGVGEARRRYLEILQEGLKSSGIGIHRRNAEAIVAGMLNWVKVNNPEGLGGHVVDDIVSYNAVAGDYRPRPGASRMAPTHARGRYLEEPALHYTPGTRITRKVAEDLKRWGIQDVETSDQEPDFEPYMQRGMLSVYNDEDWQTRLAGFYTTSSFLDAVHRGRSSTPDSTSFVPAVARGVGLGQDLPTQGTYGSAGVKPPSPVAPTR
jgi:DNA-directed RNA polymerase subunit beta'